MIKEFIPNIPYSLPPDTEKFIVNITINASDVYFNEIYTATADKTVAEIYAAYEAGKDVYASILNSYIPFSVGNNGRVEFSHYQHDNNILIQFMLCGVNDVDLNSDEWTFRTVRSTFHITGRNLRKNLLPYPYFQTTKTENGITWTDNGDGTITANGTATATTYFFARRNTQASNLSKGKYILSGCPAGGGNSTYDMYLYATSGLSGSGTDIGKGLTYTFASDNIQFDTVIRIRSGASLNNLTFYPMIRRATETDPTWVPYVS